MTDIRLAVDVMGGDNGPSITLPAAIRACRNYAHLYLNLFGPESLIRPYLYGLPPEVKQRIRITDVASQISMEEAPTSALRYKQDSTMGLALQSVKSGESDACVSAGNTGALLALSLYFLKPLQGVKRPALISSIPGNNKKRVYLLDLGANVTQDANALYQFAVMGSVMAETVEGVKRPKVALINVGVEQNKGNAIVKEANKMLLANNDINYVGYVEGDALFNASVDVIVTDGFVGNIVLKASEGLAKFIAKEGKKAANKNIWTKMLSFIARPVLKKVYYRVNPDQYNGASLIGLRGIVVKSHGNASEDAFMYAIQEAMKEVERQVPDKIQSKINHALVNKAE
ncbi:phosphate acyltransferase PlsX [Planctobacterium marinum]|uniref:phosphate acyltransferase PlsX n=1 Tax=Planctobacterium marinum TaxID=1631968 RepID=UPI001E292655|nr:phosphate acyltransferase PlsX [Planctobacterium marinum]MCC2604134.1 phosphate acyltransferase PlsX [Planctobacterium marinum]